MSIRYEYFDRLCKTVHGPCHLEISLFVDVGYNTITFSPDSNSLCFALLLYWFVYCNCFSLEYDSAIDNVPLGIFPKTNIYGAIPVVAFGTSRNAHTAKGIILCHCLGLSTIT